MMEFLHRTERPRLLAREHLGDVRTSAAGTPSAPEQREPVRGRLLPQDVLEGGGELVSVANAGLRCRRTAGRPRAAGHRGPCSSATHRSSEPAPARTIHPSAVRNPPYGANVGECVPSKPGTCPEANVLAASVPSAARANSSSEDDTCVPIPVRSRSMWAAKQSERAAQAGTHVQHRRTDLDRARPLTAGDAHHATLGLQDQIEPPTGGVGPDVAVARDRAVDDRGVSIVHGLPVQPVAREASRSSVLDEEVRGGEQTVDHLGCQGRAEVQGEASLPRVQREEQHRLVAEPLGPLHPVRISSRRHLELHDIGTQRREHGGRVRARDETCEVEHARARRAAASPWMRLPEFTERRTGRRSTTPRAWRRRAPRRSERRHHVGAFASRSLDRGHGLGADGSDPGRRRAPRCARAADPRSTGRARTGPASPPGPRSGRRNTFTPTRGRVPVGDLTLDPIRGCCDPTLRDALLERRHGTTERLDLVQDVVRTGLEFVGQRFHEVRAAQRIDGPGYARTRGRRSAAFAARA